MPPKRRRKAAAEKKAAAAAMAAAAAAGAGGPPADWWDAFCMRMSGVCPSLLPRPALPCRAARRCWRPYASIKDLFLRICVAPTDHPPAIGRSTKLRQR